MQEEDRIALPDLDVCHRAAQDLDPLLGVALSRWNHPGCPPVREIGVMLWKPASGVHAARRLRCCCRFATRSLRGLWGAASVPAPCASNLPLSGRTSDR